jgi:hypothetical protein
MKLRLWLENWRTGRQPDRHSLAVGLLLRYLPLKFFRMRVASIARTTASLASAVERMCAAIRDGGLSR